MASAQGDSEVLASLALEAVPYLDNKGGKTLADAIREEVGVCLERREKKRVENGDFRVCAAHDMAPVLTGLLGIEPKLMEKDKGFQRLVKEKALELGEERWEGLKKKSFAPKQKKKGKKR